MVWYVKESCSEHLYLLLPKVSKLLASDIYEVWMIAITDAIGIGISVGIDCW